LGQTGVGLAAQLQDMTNGFIASPSPHAAAELSGRGEKCGNRGFLLSWLDEQRNSSQFTKPAIRHSAQVLILTNCGSVLAPVAFCATAGKTSVLVEEK